MLFVGTRLMPWLLTHIAHTRSRELFILAVVAAALGTAFAAAELSTCRWRWPHFWPE